MRLVYLLHFDQPYHHARHYIGFTDWGIVSRLRYHLSGQGSRLMKAVTDAGINVRVARRWWGADRYFERQLKRYSKTRLLCPACSGRRARKRMRYPDKENRTVCLTKGCKNKPYESLRYCEPCLTRMAQAEDELYEAEVLGGSFSDESSREYFDRYIAGDR